MIRNRSRSRAGVHTGELEPGSRSALDRHVAAAARLDVAGELLAARDAYLAVLRIDPRNRVALNELGRLFDRTGFPDAARTAYRQAVAAHPDDPVSHGNLASSYLDAGEIVMARQHYERAAALDPRNAAAHACLAVIALRDGDPQRAAAHADIGFAAGATAWPYRGRGTPVDVLVIHSALGGNVAFEPFIDDRIYRKWTLVAEFADVRRPLPAHAVVLNAIGDADRCAAALRAAHDLTARSTAPIVNPPAAILQTARAENARRLRGIAAVRTPRALERTRAQLTAADATQMLEREGLPLPLIVRAAGFHTGEHCELITTPNELPAAVARMPGDTFLAIEFVDVRDADGAVRKYRMMIVDGELYALHLAVSAHWKVHYFRSDMVHNAAYRAEEAAFLADPNGTLGAGAVAALAEIAAHLRLDYAGIDFGRDRDGRLVIFEANATMVVPKPDADSRWAYRHAPVERVHAALRAMLRRRAGD